MNIGKEQKLSIYFKDGKAKEVFAPNLFLSKNTGAFSCLVFLSEGKREETTIDGITGCLFKIDNEDALVKFLDESKYEFEICNNEAKEKIKQNVLSKHLKDLKLKVEDDLSPKDLIEIFRSIVVMGGNARRRRADKLLDELYHAKTTQERKEFIKRQLRELRG